MTRSQHPLAPTYITSSVVISAPTGRTHYHIAPTESDLDVVINLTNPESTVYVTAAIQGDDSQNQVSLTVNHQAVGTKADVLVKTLGMGSANHSFKGLLAIAPNTPNCQSYLTHKSLLFDQATSKTWPALEISNNEVKCSHAATSRTITNNDLFYLRSRGLSEAEARRLLVDAFLSDVTF